MGPYVRILRLQDEFIQFGFAIAAGIFIHNRSWHIFFWALATTFLSMSAFILNEMTDRIDTDVHSWNPVHIRAAHDRLNTRIVEVLFVVISTIGLVMSFFLRLFWWGLIMYLVGVAYSLEPIRLKKRVVLDILAQLIVWFIVPFTAPVWGVADPNLTIAIVVIISFISWSIFYPYQIADLTADKKAHLHSTHVLLGLRRSLQAGLALGVVGLVLYVLFGVYRWAIWSGPLPVLCAATVYLYVRWLRMGDGKRVQKALEQYVRAVKPLFHILVPYLLIVWYFV